MILEQPVVDPGELVRRTGWELSPEGMCKAARCVPLPEVALVDGGLDVRVLAERLGAPLLHDERRDLWCLGPESGGRVLTSAGLPEITLPDLERRPFSVSSLRGQKAVLAAWASW